MTIFVAGKLINLKKNRAHWSSAISYKRTWRQKVKLACRLDGASFVSSAPKWVYLTANVWNLFDEQDGLRAALSPVLDGLQDAGAIHDDGPACGHVFFYGQVLNRRNLGVTITVEAQR